MFNALASALSGMRSNQSALDVTADNIANANTPGFKKSATTFASALQQTSYQGASSGTTVGGINPRQVGLGTSVSAIAKDMSQGSLEATGNALDLAIQGDGFFAVSDGTQNYYTRLGTFDVDSDGYVVLDGTGYRLQGNTYSLQLDSTGNQAISTTGTAIMIPTDSTLAPQRTTSITMRGNLDSTSAALTGSSVQGVYPLTTSTDGSVATEDTLLTDLSIFNGVTGAAGDTLTLHMLGTQPDGTLYTASITIHPWDDPSTTGGNGTVGELMDAMNGALVDASGTRFGKVTLDDGQLAASGVTTGDGFSLFMAETDPAVVAGGTVPDDFLDSDSGFDVNSWLYSDAANADFNWYRTRMSPSVVSSSIQVYDSQGGEHTVQARYYLTGTRTDSTTGAIETVWDMMVGIDPGEGDVVDDLVSGIAFDSEGRFTGSVGTTAAGTVLADTGYVGDPSSAQIRIDWTTTGPSDPPTIDIDLGAALSLDGLTGFGSTSTATASDQDGFASSSLDSISVSSAGDIVGLYKNGTSIKIAQVTITTFSNSAGLLAAQGTMFQASSNSGQAVTRTAGENAGIISTGVLESSNVDIASEFARLIVAQSGYQASAKVIQTSQQMLDTAMSLIR